MAERAIGHPLLMSDALGLEQPEIPREGMGKGQLVCWDPQSRPRDKEVVSVIYSVGDPGEHRWEEKWTSQVPWGLWEALVHGPR